MTYRGYTLRLQSDGTYEAWKTTERIDVGFSHPSAIDRIVTTARTVEEAEAQIDRRLRRPQKTIEKNDAQLRLFDEKDKEVFGGE